MYDTGWPMIEHVLNERSPIALLCDPFADTRDTTSTNKEHSFKRDMYYTPANDLSLLSFRQGPRRVMSICKATISPEWQSLFCRV